MDKVTAVESPTLSANYIGEPDAQLLATTYKATTTWDEADRDSYFFYRDQMREWVFFTDLRTFRERYQLVQNRGLQGFCSWVLRTEDPAIWTSCRLDAKRRICSRLVAGIPPHSLPTFP